MATKGVDYDVIVVGSGVAGALTAWKLSQLGSYRILVLEAGDNGILPDQRVRFYRTMDRQGSRGDSFAPYKELRSRIFAPSAEKSQRDPKKQREDERNYYDYTDASEPFKASYNRLVGGSTWAWRGNTPRLIPNDFRLLSKYRQGRDWPRALDYDELEPWYCEAEQELGVSGNHDELNGLFNPLFGARRSQPFPMPGIPLSYSDQRVKARIDGKWVESTQVHVVTTPQARNSVRNPRDGRQACEGHNNCIPLCPIDAKYDATVHLRRALANKVELRPRAVVYGLESGADRRVSAVRYIDWTDSAHPRERVLRSELVVLAANAIETPKILLMSRLANSSGQVGRNLMDHVQFEVTATFPEPLYPFRGPQSITSIEDFRDGKFRSERSAFRITIGNDGWGRSGSTATVMDELLDEGKYGAALPKAIAERIESMLRLSISCEMLPDANNQVDLSPDRKDALGLPRPRFTFHIGDYSRKGLSAGVRTAEALFRTMDARLNPKGPALIDRTTGHTNWNTAAHIMGTTVMGDDARNSVIDPWGRAHDVPNLWIVGSSVFPTSGTANSTLTISALTLRTADAIHRGQK